MAKLTANEKNLVKFVGCLIGEPFPTLPEVTVDDAYIGASGIVVEYSKKNKSIETKFKKQFPKFMKEYFNGIFDVSTGSFCLKDPLAAFLGFANLCLILLKLFL